MRNSSLVSALATALKQLWWGSQTICWWQQMLALHLFSSFWIWLQHLTLWTTAFFCIVYVTPSVSLALFITGFHPTLLGEWNMLPLERLNPWHTMSPVVSLKAQCLALFCLYYTCFLSVMSSAGMEYHFIVMLTTQLYLKTMLTTQLYLKTNSSTSAALSSSTMTTCLEEVEAWMSQNFLQLNGSKTEAILVGTPHQIQTSVISSVTFSGQNIPLSTSVTNLGVQMDSHLTFETHVKQLCKTSFFHLRNIARLRPMLSIADAEKLVHAFVSSRLYYCNALLIRIPGKNLQKL